MKGRFPNMIEKPEDRRFNSSPRYMNPVKWSKKQEMIFSGEKFGVTEKEYKIRPDHYLRSIQEDTTIKRGDSIFCLGCNDGSFVNCFYFEGYEAWGCDLPQVIKRAKERYIRIDNRLVNCNLESDFLPMNLGTWNLIFAKSVIEHLVNWRELPKKMRMVQHEGDMVWLSTKDAKKAPIVEKEHFVHIADDALGYIFKMAGYKVVKQYEDPLSSEGQIIVCKKE